MKSKHIRSNYEDAENEQRSRQNPTDNMWSKTKDDFSSLKTQKLNIKVQLCDHKLSLQFESFIAF